MLSVNLFAILRVCIKYPLLYICAYMYVLALKVYKFCSELCNIHKYNEKRLLLIVYIIQYCLVLTNRVSFFKLIILFRLNNCCRYVLIFHITIWYNMRKTIIAYSSCLEEYPWAAERVKNTLMQNEQLNFKNIIKYETIPRK